MESSRKQLSWIVQTVGEETKEVDGGDVQFMFIASCEDGQDFTIRLVGHGKTSAAHFVGALQAAAANLANVLGGEVYGTEVIPRTKMQ